MVMHASFYDRSQGVQTASGARFNDRNPHTAAHKKYPFGTKLKLVNPANKKELVVCINDRGPFKPNRELDLTKAGARRLDFVTDGVAALRVTVIGLERKCT